MIQAFFIKILSFRTSLFIISITIINLTQKNSGNFIERFASFFVCKPSKQIIAHALKQIKFQAKKESPVFAPQGQMLDR